MRVVIKFIFRIMAAVLYRVKLVGHKNVPKEGACIICPNHVDFFDPPVVVACTKRKVHMMAKEELFKNGFIKWLAKLFGIFPVKRGEKDLEAIKTSLRILKEGEVLGIYPEGTRNGIARGVKPKTGAINIAIKSGAPIVPLGIQGTFKPFTKVKLNYGKPISYEKYKDQKLEKEDVEKLLNELMSEIIRLTNEKI